MQEADSMSNTKSGLSIQYQAVVSLFIVFYIVIAFIQAFPSSKIPKSIRNMSDSVISFTGTKQRWNLFAPTLPRVNQYSSTLMIDENGNMQLYEWPRLNLRNFWDQFYLQHTRRFVINCLAKPRFKYYWPGICEYFVNGFSKPKSAIDQVNLRFNYYFIPKFKRYKTREILPEAYRTDTTFIYFRGLQK